MQRRTMIVGALAPWLAAPLRAAEVGGVKLPDKPVQPDLRKALLGG